MGFFSELLQFMNAPPGDEGVYDYEEPWCGFSVNKDSDQLDYAVEFLRFLTQTEKLNKLAEVKGMPSVTLETEDERFESALHPERKRKDMFTMVKSEFLLPVQSVIWQISSGTENCLMQMK